MVEVGLLLERNWLGGRTWELRAQKQVDDTLVDCINPETLIQVNAAGKAPEDKGDIVT